MYNVNRYNVRAKLIYFFILKIGVLFFINSAYGFSLMTWNMQWLTDKGDIIQGQRNAQDYLQMQKIVTHLNSDLIAFQEVDNLDTLSKVIDKNDYNLFLSDRANKLKKVKISTQFTGWAVKKKYKIVNHSDFKDLALVSPFSNNQLRYGSYIEIKFADKPSLHLLSIHLKSGCFKSFKKTSRSCKKLTKQIEALINWIKKRIEKKQEFIIAGDFNHYMNEENEWVWKKLQKQIKKQHLLNLTANTPAKCKVKKFNYRKKRWEHVIYTKLIDHIIISPKTIQNANQVKTFQYTYPNHSVSNFHLSDHCPVYAEIFY